MPRCSPRANPVALPAYAAGTCLLRLSEIAVPYCVFDDNGYDVTIASTEGGEVPLDPASLAEKDSIPEVKRFMQDSAGARSSHVHPRAVLLA